MDDDFLLQLELAIFGLHTCPDCTVADPGADPGLPVDDGFTGR